MFSPLCAQDIYLVSVGVADYPGYANDLRLPVDDAHAISLVYEKNKKATVVTLSDQYATRKTIKERMGQLFSRAGKDDIIVFFFSGHGTPNGLIAYDGTLTYDEIRKQFAKSKCTNKMVFADACFSGKLRTRGSNTSRKKTQNVMFFLSSRSNEVSRELPAMKNGFFTTFLERGLRGGADSDRNRVITAKELYDFVSSGVIKLSEDTQHPVMWGNFRDDMPVIQW